LPESKLYFTKCHSHRYVLFCSKKSLI
jgi:hypothetical protein